MAKKQFTFILDTETTITDKVVDFAGIVVNRKGEIQTQCAVLLGDFYLHPEKHSLFYDYSSPIDSIWNKRSLDRRYAGYDSMLKAGTRTLASVNAVNRWLEKVAATYDPYMTAYNLSFDRNKCANTAIDLTMFPKQFCLWGAASTRWAFSKKYKNFVVQCHAFNNVTAKGNMTYKANAEIMARFVLNNPELPDEPHTALEDIIFYELPIFQALIKNRKLADFVGQSPPGWQQMQFRDHFTAK